MSRRPIAPIEYLQVARRRWLWILVPAVAISGATAVVARKLPKLYTSQALILVEQQKVPADFVKPTVSSNVAQRLESINEQILSRTQLSEIIQKYGLYRVHKLTQDGQVAQMLSDIAVVPIINPDQQHADVSAFRISFSNRDPLLAQQVTGALSALYISENLQSRAQQAQGTEQFIDSQLQQASQTLQGLQTQLKNLKSAYMGSLPEQQQANLTVLSQLQTAQQANSDALARAQQQKTYLTSLNSAVESLGAGPEVKPPTPLETQLRDAKSNLSVDEQLYTPEHPDVIRLRAQVRALTEQVAQEQAAAAKVAKAGDSGKKASQPQVEGQIAVIDQEIKQRTADQADLKTKVAALQKRIEQLPDVEEKLADLTNAEEVAKANYTKLLENKQAAAIGAAMEQQAEGEGFRIVDPANLPERPSSPNLLYIQIIGVLAGIMAGLATGYVVEMRDFVARSEADLNFYTQVPMFAALPLISKPLLALPAPLLRSTAAGASEI